MDTYCFGGLIGINCIRSEKKGQLHGFHGVFMYVLRVFFDAGIP
jgi:hypothetical protein